LSIEVTLAVQEEIRGRLEEADRLRRKQVERARYEADLAQRRYMQVDSANRLVAASLEANWNDKLRQLSEAQSEYDRRRTADGAEITHEQRDRIFSLAAEFPKLWRDPATPDRERKRMARLVIEDVTLVQRDDISLHVRFRGGAARTLTLPRAPRAWELRQTPKSVVEQITSLVEHHTDGEVARIINELGLKSGEGLPLTGRMVARLRRDYGIRSRYDALRARGMLTVKEIAARLGASTSAVNKWRREGLLRAHKYTEKGEHLYEPPVDNAAATKRRRSRPTATSTAAMGPDGTKGV
jgi:hypothetical protein